MHDPLVREAQDEDQDTAVPRFAPGLRKCDGEYIRVQVHELALHGGAECADCVKLKRTTSFQLECSRDADAKLVSNVTQKVMRILQCISQG